jgi:hypothetical protein
MKVSNYKRHTRRQGIHLPLKKDVALKSKENLSKFTNLRDIWKILVRVAEKPACCYISKIPQNKENIWDITPRTFYNQANETFLRALSEV